MFYLTKDVVTFKVMYMHDQKTASQLFWKLLIRLCQHVAIFQVKIFDESQYFGGGLGFY